MSQSVKKRRRIVGSEIENSANVFKLFLKWLLTNETYQRYAIAKTFLRVCAPLRYFNVLRSIVAIGGHYDSNITCAQINGGFPSLPVNTIKHETSWAMIRLALYHFKLYTYLKAESFVDFPRLVLLRSHAFSNVTQVTRGNRVLYAYVAPDFGLMCQFVWAMIFDHQKNGKMADSFLCLPSWHTPNNYGICCDMSKVETFVKRKLLSSLRKMGEMAPQEWGAINGRFPYTSYAYFIKLCDTSGRRDDLTPLQRVGQFLNDWYPVELRENVCHMDLRFLTVEELQLQEDEERQENTLMNYFMIKK